VDVHCHLGYRRGQFYSADRLVEELDAREVSAAVVSPMDDTVDQSVREGNDLVIDAVRRYPDRLTGFAYVDPTVSAGSSAELDRALDAGLQGLKLKPKAACFCAAGRLMHGVVERAAREGVPVLVHSGSIMNPFMDKIGALAVRFPETTFVVSFCLSHGNWAGVVEQGAAHENIVYDTADLPAAQLVEVMDHLGPDRLMFGSGTPFGSLREELAKVRSALKGNGGGKAVLEDNARRLMPVACCAGG
jgi:predicted TIM-barrel fold metal-dependent hydrolase